jgi:hypothetical protein
MEVKWRVHATVLFGVLGAHAFHRGGIPTRTRHATSPCRHALQEVGGRTVPLAELHPDYYDVLSILDPVGTSQVLYPHFLPADWPATVDTQGLSCLALIYEFSKLAPAESRHDSDNDHAALCAAHAAHLVRTKDVPMMDDGRRGKVLLWAGTDAQALRKEVFQFIVRDPLVATEHVENWALVPRDELIAYETPYLNAYPCLPLTKHCDTPSPPPFHDGRYIKDWWVITKSYKTLLGEVERLDRIALGRKPFTQQRRRMTVEDTSLFNSGQDADEVRG